MRYAALMLTAYFAERGLANHHQTVVMAGFVATVKQWEAFDAAWNKALGGVPHFHIREFVNKDHPFYSGWGDSKRTQFMTRLVDAMLLLPQSFALGITKRAYNETNELFWLDRFIGKPWTVCAMNCVAHVEQWHKKKTNGQVDYIFHRLPPRQSKANCAILCCARVYWSRYSVLLRG